VLHTTWIAFVQSIELQSTHYLRETLEDVLTMKLLVVLLTLLYYSSLMTVALVSCCLLNNSGLGNNANIENNTSASVSRDSVLQLRVIGARHVIRGSPLVLYHNDASHFRYLLLPM
jgi:hypothetical protein